MSEFEVRKLLKKLTRGAHLKRCGEAYLVFGRTGPNAPVAAGVVDELVSRCFLRAEGDKLFLSEAGEAWLKGDDPFALQHQVLGTRRITDERGRECFVVVNAAESPLALLRQRGLITPGQFEAGEKLRRDYTFAQITPRMGIDYAAPVQSRGQRSGIFITEAALAARQRFNRALKAMGPGLADVLFDVCCYLKGVEESERGRNWPRGSARVVLRIALDRLADHYGMHAKRRARTRAWRKEDS